MESGQSSPDRHLAVHDVGNIELVVGDFGYLGYISPWTDVPFTDPFTGDIHWGCIYPAESDIRWSSANLLIGAVRGSDTLVSGSLGEFWSSGRLVDGFERQSIDRTTRIFTRDASSELDIITEYVDTLTDPAFVPGDPGTSRPHIPLGIRVTQRSMSWSTKSIDDFIIVRYSVEALTDDILKDLYLGVSFRTSVAHNNRYIDRDYPSNPVTGFLAQPHSTDPNLAACGYRDSLMLAYSMDIDGDPVSDQFDSRSPLAARGILFLGFPGDSAVLSYNWHSWLEGIHPAGKSFHPVLNRPDHDLYGLFGVKAYEPFADAARYFLMSNGEIDYDQIFTATDQSNRGWQRPPPEAERIAAGNPARAMLSIGPISDFGRGKRLTFSIALVAGDSVQQDPTAYGRLFDPANPQPFYNQLDFSNLIENAVWAKSVYDNPGVDTDGDGYMGKFRVCQGDTQWYEGDGVPDFRADVPPPSPEVRIIPQTNKLTIRWNGYYSETTVDPFTRTNDFEGYRVYVGHDRRESSMTLLSSWDQENFIRYTFVRIPPDRVEWRVKDLPFTLDSLRTLYDDPDFDPLQYDRLHPLVIGDSGWYFEPQDHNISEFRPDQIHKAYPDAPYPGDDPVLWTEDDLTYEHGDPLPKYYEYEYVYDNLLQTVTYWVSVTAFDFGFAKGGIPAKESPIVTNAIESYAQNSADSVEAYNLDAYVYPNPWRADADYRDMGYEGRNMNLPSSRIHRIHFANLPHKCRISIYSIDGDRIDSFEHDEPPGSPNAMHAEWDMISRNMMEIESGLYYWVVESETRTQIGKLMIIK